MSWFANQTLAHALLQKHRPLRSEPFLKSFCQIELQIELIRRNQNSSALRVRWHKIQVFAEQRSLEVYPAILV